MLWIVEIKAIGGWTRYDEFNSYRNAVDTADMMHGRVRCGRGHTNTQAWRWAVVNQGFDGDILEWENLDDEERMEYEVGAGLQID